MKKNNLLIALTVSLSLSAMEQPETAYSKLELLHSDLKLKIIKDVIGRAPTAEQAVKSTRTFIFNDRKLCSEMDTDKLCCIIQLLAHGWFFCDVGDVALNQLIPEKPQSKSAQHILEFVKKLTYCELGHRRHPLLVKSAETFQQFLALDASKRIPPHILADLDLNYYHPCNDPRIESCQLSPLLVTIHLRATRAAEQLITAGCNLEKKDKQNYTALHLACRFGHNKIIEALIKSGADVNARGGTCNNTPLIVLSINGGFNSCIKKMLIEAGADPSFTDIFTHTAAYYNDRKIGQVPISSSKKSFSLHP